MSCLGCSVVVLLLLNLSYVVTAIDRLQLFPFGAAQGDDRMEVGDDVSSPEIQLRTPVVYYDDFYTSLYVSHANGSRPPNNVGSAWGPASGSKDHATTLEVGTSV